MIPIRKRTPAHCLAFNGSHVGRVPTPGASGVCQRAANPCVWIATLFSLALCLLTGCRIGEPGTGGIEGSGGTPAPPHAGTDSNPAQISSNAQLNVVRTWGDLLRQPRLDAGDGATVRLGLSATHAPLNSGLLIYCLTDGYDYFKHPNITPASLGPLSISLRRGNKSLVITNYQPVDLSYKGWNTVRGCTLLFARPVLIDAPGIYQIGIFTRTGREIAKTAIGGDNSFYHPWMPLLMEQDSKWEIVSYGDWTFRETNAAVLSVPGTGIAINAWSGDHFQVFSGHANLGWAFDTKDYKPRNPASPLPPFVPDRPDPDLKLAIHDGFVTITSNTELEATRPDWRLLARWWVNGKAFVPQARHAPEFGGGDTPHLSKQIRFKLKIDPARLGARPGDRVAVQFLLCDAWSYVENPDTILRALADGKAQLTDRVQFVLE